MNVQIKKVSQTATIPTRGSDGAAGYDLYADIPEGAVVVNPGETAKISSGVAMNIPHGYFGGIYARSGLSIKNGLRPANCTGVIDEDYTGTIIVALHNDSDAPYTVEHGMRIAQIIFQRYEAVDFSIVEELDETERGSGGFGSTGIK